MADQFVEEDDGVAVVPPAVGVECLEHQNPLWVIGVE